MRAHVFISGSVQGVGFRYFVKKNAKGMGLRGYVRNVPDGRVEAVFEGEKEKIDQIIQKCRKGPFLSRVSDLEIIEEDEKGDYKIFEVSR